MKSNEWRLRSGASSNPRTWSCWPIPCQWILWPTPMTPTSYTRIATATTSLWICSTLNRKRCCKVSPMPTKISKVWANNRTPRTTLNTTTPTCSQVNSPLRPTSTLRTSAKTPTSTETGTSKVVEISLPSSTEMKNNSTTSSSRAKWLTNRINTISTTSIMINTAIQTPTILKTSELTATTTVVSLNPSRYLQTLARGLLSIRTWHRSRYINRTTTTWESTSTRRNL